jgi:GT2 family glycosyltransferase
MSSIEICRPLPGDRDAVWDRWGDLTPLSPHPQTDRQRDVAAIIVSRNRPDLVRDTIAQLMGMGRGLTMDIYTVEMGSDPDQTTEHCTLRYEDPRFLGKAYGHNVGLRLARSRGSYRYYWVLMNDLVFEPGCDAVAALVERMQAHPRLAVLSPGEGEGAHPEGRPRPGGGHHIVPSCDYLAWMVRAQAVEEAGFLNPAFKYCWGAPQELGFRLYSLGWQMAYSDDVSMVHLGGSTYGKARNTPSREEYQQKAQEFAARYFVETYGRDWDDVFTRALPGDIAARDQFHATRRNWERVLDERERELYRPRRPSLRARVARRLGLGALARPTLREQIEALHPWYYDLKIGPERVTPGVGAREGAQELAGRVRYIRRLLVNEASHHYDFRGRRLLDLGANCGYYSARYAEMGAASLLAVEGRLDHVRQGRLYWGRGGFLPEGAWEFLHGNVLDPDIWRAIEARGPFDFTLCAGILYHIDDYPKLLRRVAAVTRQAVLVDTRLARDRPAADEPGGWSFDAIAQSRTKRDPDPEVLRAVMREAGFTGRELGSREPVPPGLLGADDFALGRRAAILFLREGAA